MKPMIAATFILFAPIAVYAGNPGSESPGYDSMDASQILLAQSADDREDYREELEDVREDHADVLEERAERD